MESVWERDAPREGFAALQGDRKTDVLVIGGGITGILCTYLLREAGVDCILVEADRLCSGTTKGTTAKVTLQHGLLYDRLIRRFGWERARLYLEAQRQACDAYARLCARIPCDYVQQDAYVYSLDDPGSIERELTALERLGCKAEFSLAPTLPIRVAGAVRVRDQAQLHPLKFALSLARELPVYEQTRVRELLPGRAVTSGGVIRCKRIIVATHFPMLNKHGGYFLKLYQHRSYVLALEGAQDVEGMYVDAAEGGLSFCNVGALLLLGGGAHRTGKSGDAWRAAEAFSHRHYPTARVVARWAAQDCMTLDGVPYIGSYAKGTEGLYVATGFNKWGMTSAMVAALLLRDLVCGKENELAAVFAPSRSIWRPQLAVNALESLTGLLSPRTPRCPHLGCALRYNREEHSWDCPCHGSRFGEDGSLIDNPATGDHKGIGRRHGDA